MYTSFKGFGIRSNKYDLFQHNCDDTSETAKWLRKQWAKYETQVKDFLTKKELKKHYAFTFNCEQEEDEYTFLFPLTDNETARIKELLDVLDEDSDYREGGLGELEGENAEFDALVFSHYPMVTPSLFLERIDLEHPHHLYQMSYVGYDTDWEEPSKPTPVKVELTEEEYIYLVTYRLVYNKFTFNRLLLARPELAQTISAQLDYLYEDIVIEKGFPYLIVMDEINADAEAIEKLTKKA